MDYKKKYKELVAKIKNAHLYAQTDSTKNVLEGILPELAESEDERILEIIKHCIESRYLHTSTIKGISQKQCFAWLEKQGEQNVADKIKPKFHEGDWITNGDYTWKIVEVKPLDYILQAQDGNIVDDTISHVDEQFHSFTIEDTKDGDVLVYNNEIVEIILLFKEWKNGYIGAADTYVHMFNNKINISNWCDCSYTAHPATKEQCDLLFQKMKEAGFEWDSEKKELKKISQRMISAEAKEAMYDKPTDNDMVEALRTEYEKGMADAIAEMEKPTWSVEDMSKVQRICKYLDEAKKYYADITEVRECINWLKSLKDRVIPQSKQEWSEEDEDYFDAIITKLEVTQEDAALTDNQLKFLKSLKYKVFPQIHWKPSDEQMENLSRAANGVIYRTSLLMELYQDLKKLREE